MKLITKDKCFSQLSRSCLQASRAARARKYADAILLADHCVDLIEAIAAGDYEVQDLAALSNAVSESPAAKHTIIVEWAEETEAEVTAFISKSMKIKASGHAARSHLSKLQELLREFVKKEAKTVRTAKTILDDIAEVTAELSAETEAVSSEDIKQLRANYRALRTAGKTEIAAKLKTLTNELAEHVVEAAGSTPQKVMKDATWAFLNENNGKHVREVVVYRKASGFKLQLIGVGKTLGASQALAKAVKSALNSAGHTVLSIEHAGFSSVSGSNSSAWTVVLK